MAIDTNIIQQQAAELSSQIWSICNDLRGGMDANEFRNYILGTIFYRYLSERTEMYMQDLLKEDDISYEAAFADAQYRPIVEKWSIDHLGYIIRPQNLFRELYRRIVKPANDADKFSIEDYERAVNELTGSTLGQKSEKAFEGLFNDMRLQDTRLGDTVSERTDKIGKVISKIGELDMDLQDQQFDILGTAYMILIGLFQSGAGKKGGEFFTPVGPSTLCATLASIGLDEAKTVGDCTCGSASMLLDIRKHLTTGKIGHYYGQENNPTTYNLARMNMLMHGIDYQKFDINKGDTLINDTYGDELKLTVQVCNPPYSLKWDANPKYLDDPRYSGVGKLAPKSHADLAFVQHMVYHMDEQDGRVAVLLPHGVLFRGGAEEDIRKYLIRDLNRVDAIIGLPANLFHGASIPVIVMVLKSNRNENTNNILFIDASRDFNKGKNQNELSSEYIQKIVKTYIDRVDVPQYAHVATMEEIVENDFNLNIPRYVEISNEEALIDVSESLCAIKRIQNEKSELQEQIEGTLHLLGISKITGDGLRELFPKDDKKVPTIRFPGFTGEWELRKLSEEFIRVNERNNGQFGKDRWISVARMYYQEPDKVQSNNLDTRTYVMRWGDIAFEGHPNAEFQFGRFVVNDIGDGIISELFPIYRHKVPYDNSYWKVAIQQESIMRPIYAKAITSSGASSNKLNEEHFLRESILVPSIEEQKVIGAFFTKIDMFLSIQQHELSKWHEMKKGLLQQMFV